MRGLVALGLALSLSAVACVAPQDAQFTCPDEMCPDGFSCRDGLCRSSDEGMDGGPARDGGTDDAPPVDDGNRPDAPGEPCTTPNDCFDGNPCTDDLCPSSRCSNPPNTAGCDDAIFCNGPDDCSGGSCSVHLVDPCPGACVEGTESCSPCGAAYLQECCDGRTCAPGRNCLEGGAEDNQCGCIAGDCVAGTTVCMADGLCHPCGFTAPLPCCDNGGCLETQICVAGVCMDA